MRAVSLLFWCDRRGRFTRRDGIAPHRVLEAWLREDECQGDRFGADVLPTYPRIGRDEYQSSGVEIESAELTMEPKNVVEVGETDARAVMRLMEALDDHDDVEAVHANFDIPADVLEEIAA